MSEAKPSYSREYFVIVRNYWNEAWDGPCEDQYPALFFSRPEAEACMARLDRGDQGWHDPKSGSLSISTIDA